MSAVHLLLNPSATGRRRRRREDQIREMIRRHGHDLVELVPEGPSQIAEVVAGARSRGLERLVIVGGDGMVHHALPAVAGTGLPVGIISVGTGNDFARGLGLPTGVEQAVQAALGPAGPVDLITTVAGSEPAAWAASVVTGGFSGRVNARANGLAFPPGQQKYTVATLLELAALGVVELTLDLDGDVQRLDATLFAVGNTPYFGGGMAICPGASAGDGLLDVTVIGPVGRFTFARLLPTVFSGRHVDHPSVTTYRARQVGVSVTCDVWADGEPFVTSTLQVAPGALHVAGNLEGVRQGLE